MGQAITRLSCMRWACLLNCISNKIKSLYEKEHGKC